jgi:hypothetical protein
VSLVVEERRAMSRGRRAQLVLPALILTLAACTGGGSSSSSSSSSGASTSAGAPADGSAGRTESSPQGSGSQGSEPTEQKADFPADTSADGGPAQTGMVSTDPTGQTHVTGLRIGEHEGYSRLVVDLSSAGVPQWEVRYSTASGPGGGPVSIEGDAYLRVVLHTFAEPGVQSTSSANGSGLIVQAKTTGFFEGSEEALAGIKAGPQPFRAFTLTDPGRIVIDVRRP